MREHANSSSLHVKPHLFGNCVSVCSRASPFPILASLETFIRGQTGSSTTFSHTLTTTEIHPTRLNLCDRASSPLEKSQTMPSARGIGRQAGWGRDWPRAAIRRSQAASKKQYSFGTQQPDRESSVPDSRRRRGPRGFCANLGPHAARSE